MDNPIKIGFVFLSNLPKSKNADTLNNRQGTLDIGDEKRLVGLRHKT